MTITNKLINNALKADKLSDLSSSQLQCVIQALKSELYNLGCSDDIKTILIQNRDCIVDTIII